MRNLHFSCEILDKDQRKQHVRTWKQDIVFVFCPVSSVFSYYFFITVVICGWGIGQGQQTQKRKQDTSTIRMMWGLKSKHQRARRGSRPALNRCTDRDHGVLSTQGYTHRLWLTVTVLTSSLALLIVSLKRLEEIHGVLLRYSFSFLVPWGLCS